jgi:hypothetical protein
MVTLGSGDSVIAAVSPEQLLRLPSAELSPQALLLLDGSTSDSALCLEQLFHAVSDLIHSNAGRVGAGGSSGSVFASAEMLLHRDVKVEAVRQRVHAAPTAVFAYVDTDSLSPSHRVALVEFSSRDGQQQVLLHGVSSPSSLSDTVQLSEEAFARAAKGFVVVTGRAAQQTDGPTAAAAARSLPLSFVAAPIFPPLDFGPAPHLCAVALALAHFGVQAAPEQLLLQQPLLVDISRMTAQVRAASLYELCGGKTMGMRLGVAVTLVSATDASLDGVVQDALSEGAVLLCLYDVPIMHEGAPGGGRSDEAGKSARVGAALVAGMARSAPGATTLRLCDTHTRMKIDVEASLFLRACREAADGGDRKDLSFKMLCFSRM